MEYKVAILLVVVATTARVISKENKAPEVKIVKVINAREKIDPKLDKDQEEYDVVAIRRKKAMWDESLIQNYENRHNNVHPEHDLKEGNDVSTNDSVTTNEATEEQLNYYRKKLETFRLRHKRENNDEVNLTAQALHRKPRIEIKNKGTNMNDTLQRN